MLLPPSYTFQGSNFIEMAIKQTWKLKNIDNNVTKNQKKNRDYCFSIKKNRDYCFSIKQIPTNMLFSNINF